MKVMTDEASRKPFPLLTVSAVTLFTLLVLYVLSPAPVMIIVPWCCHRRGVELDGPLEFVRHFYTPISAVADRIPMVNDFYTWQFKALGM